MAKKSISRIRAAAGRAGATSRWGTARDRATACLRVYERDAAAIRARAKAAHTLPADVIMELMRNA